MDHPLTRWIDPTDEEQQPWINAYINQQGVAAMVAQATRTPTGYRSTKETFTELMHDPAFREVIRKMRHAWRQRQYRERNGKQLSFQLPQTVVDKLAKLAKERDQSQVKTLRQVINNAAKEQERATRQVAKEKAAKKKALQQIKTNYQQTEEVQRRIIENLLEALADNIDQCCQFVAMEGERDNEPLSGDDVATYRSLVDTRLGALEESLRDLKHIHFKGGSLRQRMAALANRHEDDPESVTNSE